MTLDCEYCGQPVDENKAWKRVIGWVSPKGRLELPSPAAGWAHYGCIDEEKMRIRLGGATQSELF